MVSRSVPPWIMNIVACVARREWNVTSSRSILFLAVRNCRWIVVGFRTRSGCLGAWKSIVSGFLLGQNLSMCSLMRRQTGAGMGTTRRLSGVFVSSSRYAPRSSGPCVTEWRT